MTTTWAAPGRVNLIGEHIDYNDGLVLPFALPFTTTARVTPAPGTRVTVSSEGVGDVEFDVDTQPGDVDDWAAYVAGVVWALRQRSLDVPGLRIEVSSDVPLGAGLSSSAALTCAVASAVHDEVGGDLTRTQLATVARASENEYVSVPTGAMDQLAAMLCEAGHALLLDCRSLQTRSIPLSPGAAGLSLLLIDTGARHRLVGSEYADRRRDCDAALAEIGAGSWRDVESSDLDRVSDPRLLRRAHHVVTEIQRVRDVAEILDAERPADIGAFLTASHESLRDDYEVSCEELDVTVDAAVTAGALGARMTGGGFGGCALVLCRDGDSDAVRRRVSAAYDERGWPAPQVWTPEPSPGAHRVT